MDVGRHEFDVVVDSDTRFMGWHGLGDGGCQIQRRFTVDVDYATEFRA